MGDKTKDKNQIFKVEIKDKKFLNWTEFIFWFQEVKQNKKNKNDILNIKVNGEKFSDWEKLMLWYIENKQNNNFNIEVNGEKFSDFNKFKNWYKEKEKEKNFPKRYVHKWIGLFLAKNSTGKTTISNLFDSFSSDEKEKVGIRLRNKKNEEISNEHFKTFVYNEKFIYDNVRTSKNNQFYIAGEIEVGIFDILTSLNNIKNNLLKQFNGVEYDTSLASMNLVSNSLKSSLIPLIFENKKIETRLKNNENKYKNIFLYLFFDYYRKINDLSFYHTEITLNEKIKNLKKDIQSKKVKKGLYSLEEMEIRLFIYQNKKYFYYFKLNLSNVETWFSVFKSSVVDIFFKLENNINSLTKNFSLSVLEYLEEIIKKILNTYEDKSFLEWVELSEIYFKDNWRDFKNNLEDMLNKISDFKNLIENNKKISSYSTFNCMINDGIKSILGEASKIKIVIDYPNVKTMVENSEISRHELSTGEKNIVSLAVFFAHVLFYIKEIKKDKKNLIIVIDDPISSFDNENKNNIIFFISHNLSKLICYLDTINNLNIHLLILTHDITSFRQLLFHIKGQNKLSENLNFGQIVDNKLCERNLDFNEYKFILEEVYKMANSEVIINGHEAVAEINKINTLRKCLEFFLFFSRNILIKQLNDVKILEKLMNNNKKHVEYFSSGNIRIFLNEGSHNSKAVTECDYPYSEYDTAQIKLIAELLLTFIYLVDKNHLLHYYNFEVNSYLESLVNRIDNPEKIII